MSVAQTEKDALPLEARHDLELSLPHGTHFRTYILLAFVFFRVSSGFGFRVPALENKLRYHGKLTLLNGASTVIFAESIGTVPLPLHSPAHGCASKRHVSLLNLPTPVCPSYAGGGGGVGGEKIRQPQKSMHIQTPTCSGKDIC